MQLRTRLVMVGAVVAVVLAYLLISGFGAGKVYYYTVDEFLAQRDEIGDEFVRISGVVAPGSINWQPAQMELSFSIGSEEGAEGAIAVWYDRVKPDLLQENVPVVVEGRMTADGVMVAERVLVKCPSKYEAAADV